MEYLRYIFQIFLLINFGKFVGSTDVECVSNCEIDGAKNIIGGEGQEIELKYTINDDYASFILYFNGTIIAQIVGIQGVEPKFDERSFINFNGTSLQNKKSFTFKILPLKRLLKGVNLVSTFAGTGPNEGGSDKHSLLVKFGPDVISPDVISPGVLSAYEVPVGSGTTIPLTLLGYPKPTVTAAIEGVPLSISDSTNATDTYRYLISVPITDKSHCGKTASIQASGYKSVSLTSKLNVVFEPSKPKVTLATFNHTSCLHVEWEEIESGVCVVQYYVTYEYVNGTTGNADAITTLATSSPLQKCFNPDTYHNGTVAISAKVGDKVGAKSDKFTAEKIEKPTLPVPVTMPPTGAASQTGNDDALKWYFILVIVLAIVLFILIIICVCLCCTGKIACGICEACGKGKNTKKLNSVRAQNGIANPHYQMHSVEDLEVAAGLKPPPKSEGAYAEIGSRGKSKEMPVVEYTQPDTLDKTLIEPASIYAELGPGGREGEKPQLEPSLYAQVNTDDAYYPPLNPDNPEPPIYAISSKKNPDLLVQMQDEKFVSDPIVIPQGSMLPPSEYEDDGMNPVTV